MRLFSAHSFLWLLTWIGVYVAQENVYAQIFVLDPQIPLRPWSVISFAEEYVPETSVSDPLNSFLETPSVSKKDQIFSVDLKLLNFFRRKITLTYRNGNSLAQLLSDESSKEDSAERFEISKEDLPTTLFDEGWSANLPLPIDEDGLFFSVDVSLTSDKKDISNEDYNSSVAINYFLNPQEKISWVFGLSQSSFLGEIEDISPLATVNFLVDGTDSQWLFTISTEGPAVQYTLQTQLDLEIYITLVELSAYTRFLENWSAELNIEENDEYYRLTKNEPWNSSILNSSYRHSILEIGYHLFGGLLLKGGMGILSNRRYTFLNKNYVREKNYFLQENFKDEREADYALEEKSLHSFYIAIAF